MIYLIRLSKAFDRVWHDGLLYKLERCGISGQLLFLVKSFLKDRKQRTVLNGQCSSWGDISSRVPQGSILGPLFFLVYINDLTEDLRCNVKLLLMILCCSQSRGGGGGVLDLNLYEDVPTKKKFVRPALEFSPSNNTLF